MRLRKILFLVSVLLSCTIQAQDLKIHVDKKGKVGFADSNGNVVIKCIYESAYPFSDGYAIVTKSGKSGIIDASGKVVLPLKYNSINPWNNNLYLIKAGKVQGLATHSGKIVLPAKYSFVSKPNVYGKALIAVGGKQTSLNKKRYMANAKLGIVNSEGSILVTPKYKGLYEFSVNQKNVFPYYEGTALAAGQHFLTDTLKTNCEYLGFNKNPLLTNKSGIMTGTGKEILKQGLYDLVMCPQGDMVRYYNIEKKKTICGYHNLETGKGFIAVKIDKNIGSLNYWSHGDFNGSIAPVNNESWCFIDKTGKVVRQGYQSLKHSLSYEWAALNGSGKWDVFDRNNQGISGLSDFEDINFSHVAGDEEIYSVKKGNSYGAITKSGKIVIPFEYDYVSGNAYDVVPVMKDSLWGAFDSKGQKIIPVSYKKIYLPTERNAKDIWVGKEDNLYYHYHVTSKTLAKTGYESANNFHNGIALVRPVGMKLEDNEVNRAQMFAPNTNHKEIASVKISESIGCFGYLINSEDLVLFDLPVSTFYLDSVVEKLKQSTKKLTEAAKRNILLDVTKENRSYNLKSTLDENEWNY